MKNSFVLKKITFIFITFILFLFVFFIKDNIFRNHNSTWLNILGIIGWGTLIWSIITWFFLRKEIICFYVVFLLLLYLFTFGQSLLIPFSLVSDTYNLFNIFSVSKILNAQIYTLLCLISFHFGALIICKKPSQINDYEKSSSVECNLKNNALLRAIKYVGIILLLFSFPGFIIGAIKAVITVINSGYAGIYGYGSEGIQEGILVRIFSYTSSYFLPSLVCLLVANKYNLKNRKLILILMMFDIIYKLYIGGRSGAVISIIVIILTYHYFIRPISLKQFFMLALFSYFLISFLSVIAKIRNISNRGIMDYITAFRVSYGKENLFFSTISELGYSMFPLLSVIDIVPFRIDYYKGKSYLYALLSVFPNLGFWDVHPASLNADGANWLMKVLNLSYGPGFSLIADSYRNFGWYGFIVMMGFGLFFGKIYSLIDKNEINKRPELFCSITIFFSATAMCVRGDNLNIVRPMFYVVIPIYFSIKIIYNSILKNKKHHMMRKISN